MREDLLRADKGIIAYYFKPCRFGSKYRLWVTEHIIPADFQSGLPNGLPFTRERKATIAEVRNYRRIHSE